MGDAEKGVFFVGEVAVRTFTDEQKQKLLDLIAKWKSRLRLEHWRVIVEWDKEPNNGDDVTLEVYPMPERHTAHIRVGCWFSDAISDAERENAVVHELLHIHAEPVWETVTRVLEHLSPQAQGLINEELRARFEVMIDAIATSIVPLD